MNNILDKIDKNLCTLIAYDCSGEKEIYNLLDPLPNKIIFSSNYNFSDIELYFTSSQIIRDIKISSLFSKSNINVIIDLNQVKYDDLDDNLPGKSKSKYMQNFIRQLQSKLYTLSSEEFKLNLILLSRTYTTVVNEINSKHIYAPSPILYSVDFAISFINGDFKILKER